MGVMKYQLLTQLGKSQAELKHIILMYYLRQNVYELTRPLDEHKI